MRPPRLALLAAAALLAVPAFAAEKLDVLLIDGQNNHNWRETTPLIQATLEGTGRFAVDVATTPAQGEGIDAFQPEFSEYDVVVSNYNGEPWSEATSQAFEKYVRSGGGFVSVHAADNAFPEWDAYNRMIGLGGWGGRNETHGPYVRWRDGKPVRDPSPGPGGAHGRRHPFEVVVRDPEHPITRGIPRAWMHAEDELYAQLRGPADGMQVLATAFSAPDTGGTGEHEPVLMAIRYGDGRVFHTTLGHDATAIHGVGFQVTLQRGAEWAATGKVTLPPVDAETLTGDAPAQRDPMTLVSQATDRTAVDGSSPPDPESDGWVELFNGEDLEGWTQKNGTATFRVEDGVIVGKTSVGSPNSFLTTEDDYRNFELAFEVHVDDELNSGVQIRSATKPDGGRVHGPQIEIEASPGESGYVYGEATGREWLSKDLSIKDAYRNGQWNRFLVRAVGPRIQTWVNGRKIEDLVDEQSPQKGFIGLQVHSIPKDEGPYEVRWRNIRIRPLPDDAELADEAR